MRRFSLGLLTTLFFTSALHAHPGSLGYEEPPNPCYEGCSPWMENLVTDFHQSGGLLEIKPQVFSGECRHLSQSLNPDHSHSAVVMIDQRSNSEDFYFSTIFSYFSGRNEFVDWDLQRARDQMHPDWQIWGTLIRGSLSTRVEILNPEGRLANTHWMRQNPINGTLYFMTYFGPAYQKTFCELKQHPASP
jgi:hypothetical protein